MSRGFSLVEVLLYAALSSIILAVIASMHFTFTQSRIKHQTISEVEQQGAQALQAITQIIRNAESITSPSAGASSSTLELGVYSSGDDPTIFDVSGGVIRVCEGSGCSAVNLTSDNLTASAVTFENLTRSDTAGVVKIEFTLSRINLSGRNEYDYEKTFYATAALRQPL